MGTFLTILVLASGLAAFVTGIRALQAGLRLRRTRLGLWGHLLSEVSRLAGRAAEVEKNLTALDARTGVLPVRVLELQHNLATLRILTSALGTSLRQAQRALRGGPKPSPSSAPSGAGDTSRGPVGQDRRGTDAEPTDP